MPKINCKPLPPLSEGDIARFWSKVDKTPGQGPKGDCWCWTACRLTSGYGQLRTSHGMLAHRVAYFIQKGEDPYPMLVLHSCDNRLCCNGEHLSKGTHQDNVDDCCSKRRQARSSTHGKAKVTPDQVREIRRLYAEGWTSPALAAKFGMASYSATWRIATGRERRFD